jgi:hypothetical protein
MNRYLAIGLTQLFRGARRGQPFIAAAGAALTFVGLLRRFARPDRELIYARTLKDGQGLTVKLERGAVEAQPSADGR